MVDLINGLNLSIVRVRIVAVLPFEYIINATVYVILQGLLCLVSWLRSSTMGTLHDGGTRGKANMSPLMAGLMVLLRVRLSYQEPEVKMTSMAHF